MTEPTNKPYDYALSQINQVNEQTNRVTGVGDAFRPLDPTAVNAVLNARSNLAIAAALLVVADALRDNQP
ncbi:hypothetical protein [Streptomyces sp. NPDC002547]